MQHRHEQSDMARFIEQITQCFLSYTINVISTKHNVNGCHGIILASSVALVMQWDTMAFQTLQMVS